MADIYEAVLQLRKRGETGVLVTVVDREGSAPTDIGSKMLVFPSGETIGTVGGGMLENEAVKNARDVMQEGKSLLQKYSLGEKESSEDSVKLKMMCGGNITLFYEYIGKKENVFIFGAGHIGKALVHHLKNGNNFITVIETRENILATIEDASKILVSGYRDIKKDVSIPDGSFIIVATHSHNLDFEVLKNIYASDWKPAYVGVIASVLKTKTMVKKLHEELGNNINIGNLYMPIGLNIGGGAVDEIAVSIIAEMQALRHGKTAVPHMRRIE